MIDRRPSTPTNIIFYCRHYYSTEVVVIFDPHLLGCRLLRFIIFGDCSDFFNFKNHSSTALHCSYTRCNRWAVQIYGKILYVSVRFLFFTVRGPNRLPYLSDGGGFVFDHILSFDFIHPFHCLIPINRFRSYNIYASIIVKLPTSSYTSGVVVKHWFVAVVVLGSKPLIRYFSPQLRVDWLNQSRAEY